MIAFTVRPSICGCLLVLLTAAAHADILPFSSATFNLSTDAATGGSGVTNTNSVLLDVPQFDPSLGTLTGITLSIGGGEEDITSTVTSGTLLGDGETTRVINLVGLGSTTITTDHSVACSVSCGYSELLGGTSTSPFFNAGYIGTGQVSESLSLSSFAFVGSGSGTIENKGSWTSTITGEYTYMPATAAVPEPTSFALLITAVGVLAFVSLRNSRRRN